MPVGPYVASEAAPKRFPLAAESDRLGVEAVIGWDRNAQHDLAL